MVRRSQAASNVTAQVEELRRLLDNFVQHLGRGDLRSEVRSLVPAFHALRDLGSGLLKEGNPSNARDRLLLYLQKFPRTLIDGDELMVVSGIGEWARRVRELRVQYGWVIYTGATLRDMAVDSELVLGEVSALLSVDASKIKPTQYVLMHTEQDREAALRWNQLNEVRRRKGESVSSKILAYLRLNVGKPVTGEELRYVAGEKSEWARRVRELRTEEGWPVFTKMQGRPDLSVGEYLLEEDKQAEEHDRHIPDGVRVEVLERDKFQCVQCGWSVDRLQPGDPRKLLELHHLVHHSDKGANTPDNLVTLCNVHHDQVHSGTLELGK